VFDRYAFDLSQYGAAPTAIKYSVRERYLWEVLWPDTKDPQYHDQAGQFRAELHERLLAPIYPFAFVLIAFSFLGAPRTTRQSALWSLTAVILSVSTLRLIGFACAVLTVNHPFAPLVQWGAVLASMAASLYAISRGLIIEQPALLTQGAKALQELVGRYIGKAARAAP